MLNVIIRMFSYELLEKFKKLAVLLKSVIKGDVEIASANYVR